MLSWEAPVNIQSLFIIHTGNAERVIGRCALVEEENVGFGVLGMAGIDALVLSVMNPESIKNDWHAGHFGGAGIFIEVGASSAIHGNADKRPLIRLAGGSVEAIPAI